jgi:hypothetical protein
MAYIANRAYFADVAARTARLAEASGLPAGSFDNGMNSAAMPILGIGAEYPNLSGLPQQFTLLDQTDPSGTIRVPQISSSLGGNGLGAGIPFNSDQPVQFGSNPGRVAKIANPELDGAPSNPFPADLVTLAAGWVPDET